MTTLPETIYKYQKIDDYSLSNLKNAQIFFNAPKKFNDPFEGAVASQVSFGEGEYQKILTHYREKFSQKFLQKTTSSKQGICKTLECSLNKKKEEWSKKRGCWCSSKTNKNILMWSHYGDYHEGMCLAFETSLLPQELKEKIRVVNYVQEPPKFCPLCLIGGCECSDTLEPLYTKFTDWAYEEEVRVFHQNSGGFCDYVNALKAVYFGARANEANIKSVREILHQNKNIKYFKGELSPTSYEVFFREI